MTTTTSPTSAPDRLGLYQLCLDAEQSILDGAPTLQLSLLVDAVRGTVTGQGVETPAEFVITKENRPRPVTGITGTIHATPTGAEPVTQVMSLTGGVVVNFPPPAIGSMVLPFTATFAMDPAFKGHGGWSVGGEKVDDATIHAVACTD